jgi:nucleoside-diphosphate-sugar epimerase
MPLPNLEGRIVLVTGATGYIGGRLCERLLQLGADVHAISRKPPQGSSPIRWTAGDIADWQTTRDLVHRVRPDAIVHLACAVTGLRELSAVLPTLHGTVVASINLLQAATEAGCRRIVLAGSLEEPALGEPLGTPAYPYAAAKQTVSAYARMFHALYATPVTTARIFMAYGPGHESLRRLVPHVILALLRGETPELSSGQRPVDWIYIDDVVDGLLAAVLVPGLEGLSIDLGSGTLVTIRKLVEKIYAQLAPGLDPPFGSLPDRAQEQTRVADPATATSLTGWHPQVSLDDGLRRTIEWYREQLCTQGELAPGLRAQTPAAETKAPGVLP